MTSPALNRRAGRRRRARQALVSLALGTALAAAHPRAQSEPPYDFPALLSAGAFGRPKDGPFNVDAIVDAPFAADAVTTITPAGGGTAVTVRDRYYRDSMGRVRAERRTPTGNLVAIVGNPQDGERPVSFLNPDERIVLNVPIYLAWFIFNSGTNVTIPRAPFRHVLIGPSPPQTAACDGCPASSPIRGDGAPEDSEVSAELHLVVRAKRIHARVGTIEFRVTNIRREEPPPELFVVPTSYGPAPVGTRFELLPPGQ
jgi:hypothetical protein